MSVRICRCYYWMYSWTVCLYVCAAQREAPPRPVAFAAMGFPMGKGAGYSSGPRTGEVMTGMVKSYNRKGFGFIMCQNLDVDVYFSRESLAPALQTSDLAGEYVTFEVTRFPDGKLQARGSAPPRLGGWDPGEIQPRVDRRGPASVHVAGGVVFGPGRNAPAGPSRSPAM